MAAFQRHFLVYFILGMPPAISVHSEPGGKSSGGVQGPFMWPPRRGKLPNSFRTSHSEPVGTNDERKAPNTQTHTQTNNLCNTACALWRRCFDMDIQGLSENHFSSVTHLHWPLNFQHMGAKEPQAFTGESHKSSNLNNKTGCLSVPFKTTHVTLMTHM